MLKDNTLQAIATYLNSEACTNNVFLMVGAGISTAAGIPDFRSPKTGLYANLAKLNLPYPEAVFDIHYFQENPQPFYTLARDIAPGKFKPTVTHAFIRLLHIKGLLHTCYTQNIDCLERIAGVPPERIIEAHGSFASQSCIDCGVPFDSKKMKEAISEARVVRCDQRGCGGLVKPDIVFFGESLPPEFSKSIPAVRSAALVIVMGTSLKVHPFAILPNLVPESCPRLLLNLEPAGDIGDRSDDVVHLGDCDTSVRTLCDLLGWRSELEKLWKDSDAGEFSEPSQVGEETAKKTPENKDSDNDLEKLIEQVVEDMENALNITTKEDGVPENDEKTNVHPVGGDRADVGGDGALTPPNRRSIIASEGSSLVQGQEVTPSKVNKLGA